MAPYTAAHVANFFLDKGEEEGRGIDTLKLQKLVYISYGWALALLHKSLFDEPIEAWKHGPVIPSLYHEFKHYRWNPIEEHALSIDWEKADFIEPHIPMEDSDTHLVLTKVWDVYKRFSGWDLRTKTHESGTPWKITYTDGVRSKEIPDSLIKDHFETRIREYLETAIST